MENLKILQEKVSELLRAHAEAEGQLRDLKVLVEKQRKEMELQESQIAHLNRQLELSRVQQISADLEEDKREQLKKELDQVISLLERNISLLK